MASKKKQATIPGQAKPKDAATSVLWKNPEYFAEVFNKIVFKSNIITPDELDDASEIEATMLRVRHIYNLTLKNTRDVAKIFRRDGIRLMILGIENQSEIDYQMPFRILESDFINYARQVADIVELNRKMKKGCKGEYTSGFLSTDRIKPVITLVIYYGDEKWDRPLSLRDMFVEGIGKYVASNYEMHLLDVKHLCDEELNQFSDDLKAFFGFLKYAKATDKLTSFMTENDREFYNLPMITTDALIELTGSKALKDIKKNFATPTGGVNMIDGIKMFGQQQRQAGIDETNMRVATVMIKAGEPLEKIVSYSNLAVEHIKNIAKSLGATLA